MLHQANHTWVSMICLSCSQRNHSERTWILYRRESFFSFFVKLVSSIISNQSTHQKSKRSNSTFSSAISIRYRSNSLRSIILQDFRKYQNLHQNVLFFSSLYVLFISVVSVTKFLYSTMICIIINDLLIWFLNSIERLKIQFYTIAICF